MKRIIILSLPVLVALAGCSSTPSVSSLLTPYRIDIRQGNFVSEQMAAQLKLGQSRDQVRFILGTPLVADPFHADRWDYVYRFQPGRGEVQQHLLTVYFVDAKLARIEGDVATSPAATAGTPATQAAERYIDIGPAAGSDAAAATKPEAGKSAPAAY